MTIAVSPETTTVLLHVISAVKPHVMIAMSDTLRTVRDPGWPKISLTSQSVLLGLYISCLIVP